ncbi:MAG: SAM-dependent methyltransferase [Bacteroidales bacterium]|nr:SAM-dependent methyltransferase [Bacteroidales bacterium]
MQNLSLLEKIRHTRFEAVPLSDYNRNYILRLLPDIDYYFAIWECCVDEMLLMARGETGQLTVVDYGGGHGFVSMILKERGVGRVLYVDHNPQSVQAAKTLAQLFGLGPDAAIEGEIRQLREWCESHGVAPDALMGMDVIEHIYCLDDFFCELHALNPAMPMLFTTGSNPYNYRATLRLRRIMKSDEELFRQRRRDYIAAHFADLDAHELDYWAEHTRGLTFDDVRRAVECQSPNLLRDPFNTCDPETGSWTERILSLEEYRGILQPYGDEVTLENGFYNEHSHRFGKRWRRLFNRLLRWPSFTALAPFVILKVTATQDPQNART